MSDTDKAVMAQQVDKTAIINKSEEPETTAMTLLLHSSNVGGTGDSMDRSPAIANLEGGPAGGKPESMDRTGQVGSSGAGSAESAKEERVEEESDVPMDHSGDMPSTIPQSDMGVIADDAPTAGEQLAPTSPVEAMDVDDEVSEPIPDPVLAASIGECVMEVESSESSPVVERLPELGSALVVEAGSNETAGETLNTADADVDDTVPMATSTSPGIATASPDKEPPEETAALPISIPPADEGVPTSPAAGGGQPTARRVVADGGTSEEEAKEQRPAEELGEGVDAGKQDLSQDLSSDEPGQKSAEEVKSRQASAEVAEPCPTEVEPGQSSPGVGPGEASAEEVSAGEVEAGLTGDVEAGPGQGSTGEVEAEPGQGSAGEVEAGPGQGSAGEMEAGPGQGSAEEVETTPGQGSAGEVETAPGQGLAEEVEPAPGQGSSGEVETASGQGSAGEVETPPGQGSAGEVETASAPGQGSAGEVEGLKEVVEPEVCSAETVEMGQSSTDEVKSGRTSPAKEPGSGQDSQAEVIGDASVLNQPADPDPDTASADPAQDTSSSTKEDPLSETAGGDLPQETSPSVGGMVTPPTPAPEVGLPTGDSPKQPSREEGGEVSEVAESSIKLPSQGRGKEGEVATEVSEMEVLDKGAPGGDGSKEVAVTEAAVELSGSVEGEEGSPKEGEGDVKVVAAQEPGGLRSVIQSSDVADVETREGPGAGCGGGQEGVASESGVLEGGGNDVSKKSSPETSDGPTDAPEECRDAVGGGTVPPPALATLSAAVVTSSKATHPVVEQTTECSVVEELVLTSKSVSGGAAVSTIAGTVTSSATTTATNPTGVLILASSLAATTGIGTPGVLAAPAAGPSTGSTAQSAPLPVTTSASLLSNFAPHISAGKSVSVTSLAMHMPSFTAVAPTVLTATMPVIATVSTAPPPPRPLHQAKKRLPPTLTSNLAALFPSYASKLAAVHPTSSSVVTIPAPSSSDGRPAAGSARAPIPTAISVPGRTSGVGKNVISILAEPLSAGGVTISTVNTAKAKSSSSADAGNSSQASTVSVIAHVPVLKGAGKPGVVAASHMLREQERIASIPAAAKMKVNQAEQLHAANEIKQLEIKQVVQKDVAVPKPLVATSLTTPHPQSTPHMQVVTVDLTDLSQLTLPKIIASQTVPPALPLRAVKKGVRGSKDKQHEPIPITKVSNVIGQAQGESNGILGTGIGYREGGGGGRRLLRWAG